MCRKANRARVRVPTLDRSQIETSGNETEIYASPRTGNANRTRSAAILETLETLTPRVPKNRRARVEAALGRCPTLEPRIRKCRERVCDNSANRCRRSEGSGRCVLLSSRARADAPFPRERNPNARKFQRTFRGRANSRESALSRAFLKRERTRPLESHRAVTIWRSLDHVPKINATFTEISGRVA